mmetsp:Transcript_17366/g.24147  ORF Transcript_17366/g.24147 Transcript_17366/m.24147 type:complete len:149 (-) Transcript_17366:767-1213(-)
MNSKFECFINVKKKSKIAVDKNKIKKLKKIWYDIYFIFRNVLKSYISMNLKKKKIEILCDTKLSVYSKNFETFFDALCVGFSVKDSSVLLLSDRILFIKVSLENLVDKKYRRKFLIMNLIGKVKQRGLEWHNKNNYRKFFKYQNQNLL